MKKIKPTISNKQRRRQLLKNITSIKKISPTTILVDPSIWIHEGREKPLEIDPKARINSLAGSIDAETADSMLDVIRKSRRNKTRQFNL